MHLWLASLFEWRVLPFGLKCSPRVITKVLRPVMAYLRTTFAILISIYIDDILLQADSPEKAFLHAQVAALLLRVLGWSLNWKFRSRRWGSSLPCPRTRDSPLSPHRRERKFSGTRVCRIAFNDLPQPLRSPIRSFRTLRQVCLEYI